MPVFPAVDDPVTVGFIRQLRHLKRGEQSNLEFLYNGGWLQVAVSQTDFYGRATHLRISGTDNRSYTVLATMSLSRRGTANVWHDLKKLADPSYDHPFSTGMGAEDVEHPFHNPGPEPIRVA